MENTKHEWERVIQKCEPQVLEKKKEIEKKQKEKKRQEQISAVKRFRALMEELPEGGKQAGKVSKLQFVFFIYRFLSRNELIKMQALNKRHYKVILPQNLFKVDFKVKFVWENILLNLKRQKQYLYPRGNPEMALKQIQFIEKTMNHYLVSR